MKNLIERVISWDKIGSHPKEAYRYAIERAVMGKDTAILTIRIRLNFVIPYEDVLRMKALIRNQISGLSDVVFQFIYEKIVLTGREIIRHYIEHMIAAINGSFAHITKTIYPEEFEYDEKGGLLTIYALGAVAVKELNEKVSGRFAHLLSENFGIETSVIFVNEKDSYEKTRQIKKASASEELKEAVKMQTGTKLKKPASGGVHAAEGSKQGGNGREKWQRRDTYEPVSGNRIMGKPISGDPIPLSSITVDSGQVVVEGILFKMESRTIRNDKKLVTMCITDKRTSICVKAFVPEKKWADLEENLRIGDAVKIRGNAEWDTYENVLVVMGKDLEKGIIKKRKDACEKKRVELHAHTKMSSMDGMNEVAGLVETSAFWGQPAVAITDHGVVQGFPDAAKAAKGLKKKDIDIKIIYGMEGYLLDDKDCIQPDGSIDYKSKGTYHIILLAQTQEGLKNMYKLVSLSHLNYFYKRPRIPRSVLSAHREGLIIGSACEAGELFSAVLSEKPQEEMEAIGRFYDYFEIQPVINNRFLVEDRKVVADAEGLRDLNRKIVALGERMGKPVVATTDAHYGEPEDALYRNILHAGMGFKDAESGQGLYLRTTDEMLEEFAYLGEEKAFEVVVENTNRIADLIEEILPVPKGKYPPKIEGAEETLRKKCMERAHGIYGEPLPERIGVRLEKELSSIIGNGYAVMYVSAEMLVQKSLSDGYLVGSRGSVGSSFAATMAGITEVNPLAPHYICPECKYLEWGDEKEYDCGVDMPRKDCPVCGTPFKQDGFSIPFETFLGFDGDKEPDIDLNFAGEYQATAHKYVDTIFGAKNVYKAGTIGTVADKTAYGFVMKYYEARQQPINKFEADRLAMCCTGVKRTTGQHPGGIIIVPDNHEIYEFCPVQHPANDTKTDIVTTHFDYHKIDENLLKLDILGHDVPSMIRQLQDMTGVDPLNVPLKDERVTGIFNGIEGLDIMDPDYRFTHGSYAIPEFGTKFVRQMLDDTTPDKFADLVRISGFSHGTDVWINNAQEFIRNGVATMKDVISTRDDIMNYLILKGLPNKDAFKIMEAVRKGRGLTEEAEKLMRDNDVPDWYIESCKRIQYMFPRAHAVAYVMMSYRIAYYKVYHPVEFYAVYFTTKVSEFDAETIIKGSAAVLEKMDSIELKGKNATKKEEDEILVLEAAYEMYARGYEFLPVSIEQSDAVKFTADEGKVRLPFVALTGVGENAAKSIAEEYKQRPFETIEEIQTRAKVNKTAIEALRVHGVLAGLPESDQLSLF